jgi:hypothetical protein
MGEARLEYVVTATLPDGATLERYVSWLCAGHVQAVLAGGAERAEVVHLEGVGEPLRVQTRYVFPSRGAYDRYIAEHAPGLRADGQRLFGPGTGVSFERSVGKVVWQSEVCG